MSKKTNNLTPKILALLIAIFLWSYVMSDVNPEDYKIVRNVDVNLQNLAEIKRDGLVIMGDENFKVNVRIDGKKSEIGKVKTENIVASLNLRGYGEGQYKIGVNASIQGSSANIRISSIEPREILVNFEKIITKEKEVSILTEGEMEKNFVLDSAVTKPQTILLTGPRSWVNEVAEARVLVNISGKKTSTSLTLPIQILDDMGEDVIDVGKDPAMVEVVLNILPTKIVPIQLQTYGSLPENFRLSELNVSPSSVIVKGDASINEIEYIKTKPVFINSLLEETRVELELELPEQVELLRPDEKIFLNFVIDEIIERDMTLNFQDIEKRNLGEGLDLDLGSGVLNLSLKGPKRTLENLKSEDIRVYLDLNNLGPGTYDMSINLERIEGVNYENISPERLDIRIE